MNIQSGYSSTGQKFLPLTVTSQRTHKSGNGRFPSYITSWCKSQLWLDRVGGVRPPAFTLFTITYKVALYAPAERARILALPLYLLCGHLHQRVFSLSSGFLGFEISRQQLKVGVGLSVFITSFLPLKVRLFSPFWHFIYIKNTSFPHRNNN